METNLTNGSLLGSLDNGTCPIQEDEHNDYFELFIYGILLNIFGLLGLIGNGISITILSRQNMRSSINCCLVGLASFDAILIVTSLLLFGLPAILKYTGTMLWYLQHVNTWVTLVAYPIGNLAQTGSVYLTVTVTIERYVAVCHPLRARSLCTYGRARLYVIGVTVFSLIYNASKFFELTYKICGEEEHRFVIVAPTEMRERKSYITVYITWMYFVVMYLLPFLSLLIFNIFIYKQVRIANHERQRLSRQQKKELGLAVMLLCVVVVFFLCNILAFVVNILEMCDVKITKPTMINNLLVTVNSSVNFIIYCIFGQKFRRLFLQLFCFDSVNEYIANESGMNGSSMYGGGRSFANGRTSTQCIRMSSWKGSQITRAQQQGGRQSESMWNGRRGIPTKSEYVNVPTTDKTATNVTESSIISQDDKLIEQKENDEL